MRKIIITIALALAAVAAHADQETFVAEGSDGRVFFLADPDSVSIGTHTIALPVVMYHIKNGTRTEDLFFFDCSRPHEGGRMYSELGEWRWQADGKFMFDVVGHTACSIHLLLRQGR